MSNNDTLCYKEYYDCECHSHVLVVDVDNYADEFQVTLMMYEQTYRDAGRLTRAWRALRGKDQLVSDVVLNSISSAALANQIQDCLRIANSKKDLTGESLAYIHSYPDIEPV
jgi:hypothetical protein